MSRYMLAECPVVHSDVDGGFWLINRQQAHWLMGTLASDDCAHRPPAPPTVHTCAARLGDVLSRRRTVGDQVVDRLDGHTPTQANEHLTATSILKHFAPGGVSTNSAQ